MSITPETAIAIVTLVGVVLAGLFIYDRWDQRRQHRMATMFHLCEAWNHLQDFHRQVMGDEDPPHSFKTAKAHLFFLVRHFEIPMQEGPPGD